MTRISRFKLNDRVLKKLFWLFFEVVGKKKNADEFNKTIYDLLSPVERVMIAKRIAVVYLLMKKIDYKTICNILKVSPSTVAKFNLLMEKSNGIVPSFRIILRDEKITDFLEEIFLSIRGPGVYGTNWSNAWQRKIRYEQKKRTGI